MCSTTQTTTATLAVGDGGRKLVMRDGSALDRDMHNNSSVLTQNTDRVCEM